MDRIAILKKLDAILGCLLIQCLPRPRTALFQKAHAILLIRPGGIGDAVHLVPAIQALQKSFSHVAIDLLAERRNAGAFVLCPGIRQVYLYDHLGQLRTVLRNHYDVVIDTEQWHRLSALVARLVKAPVKIGFATNDRTRMFTHGIPYSHDDYEAASFLRLLGPLGITGAAVPAGPWLDVPAPARLVVAGLLPDDVRRPLVALFPGASIAERLWGTERFRAVVEHCLSQELRVVVVGGEGERAAGERIVAGLDALNLAGCTSLAETAAVLEQAAVVISGDSGILHIAVALDRPTVSLFGSGIAAKWAPYGPRHIVMNKDLPCSPCTRFGTTPPCPHDHRCMREITVDEVRKALDAVVRDREPG